MLYMKIRATRDINKRYRPVVDKCEFSVDAVSRDELSWAWRRHEVARVWATCDLQSADGN